MALDLIKRLFGRERVSKGNDVADIIKRDVQDSVYMRLYMELLDEKIMSFMGCDEETARKAVREYKERQRWH